MLLYGTIILHFNCSLSHAPLYGKLFRSRNANYSSYNTLRIWKSREKRISRFNGTDGSERMRYSCGTNYAVLRSSGNQIYFHYHVKIREFCPARNARTRVSYSLWYASWVFGIRIFAVPHSCSFSLARGGRFCARIVIANSPSPIVIIGYKWASRQEWFLVPRLTVRHLRIFLAEVMIISIRRLSTIHHMLIYMLIRTAHLSITALIYNYIRLWNALFTTRRSKCIFTRFEMLFECAKHFECNTCLLDAIASRVAKYFFILNKHIFTYPKYIDMLFSIFL